MIQAKIVNEPEVRDGKWGEYIFIKLKVLQTGENVVVFGKLNDPITSSKVFGDIVSITKNDKGKYKIVAPIENKRAKISQECRGCGRCVEICPQNAIDLKIDDNMYISNAIQQIEKIIDVS